MTQREENALVEHVNQFTSQRFKVSSSSFCSKALELMKEKDEEKTKLGKDWLCRFQNCNPELVFKKAEKTDPQ